MAISVVQGTIKTKSTHTYSGIDLSAYIRLIVTMLDMMRQSR